jgi:molybdopterin synthase sulfur carrier subunit
MRVHIPGPLRSYTEGASEVTLAAPNLESLLGELDRRFAGMRFRVMDEQDRIRPHIRLFVNSEETSDLRTKLSERDEIHIICALSGG